MPSAGSARHRSPQPNLPGRGIIATYPRRFWVAVLGIGVGTGLFGALLTVILRAVERLSWSYRHGTLLDGAARQPALRHIVVLAVAGLIAGAVSLAIRRMRGSGAAEISEALWVGEGRLSFWKSQARALLSIVIVGMGVSLGREGAPQLAGSALASTVSERARLEPWQRRLLIACGAGAGMAAVYNVPLGGALFASEVLLGTLALPLVLPALATSVIATLVAWIAVPVAPTYRIPTFTLSAPEVAWAVVIGPLAALLAIGWTRAIGAISRRRPRRAGRVIAPIAIFTVLGALSIPYPALLGNGKDIAALAFIDRIAFGTLVALLVLKPLITAACLGSGAPGGLFTPTLAFGAVFGGVLGHLWGELWPGAMPGGYAIIGAAVVLAASMQGPLAASVLVLELTQRADTLMVPILLGAVIATVLSRRFAAPSIYSARIVVGPPGGHEVSTAELADLVGTADLPTVSQELV